MITDLRSRDRIELTDKIVTDSRQQFDSLKVKTNDDAVGSPRRFCPRLRSFWSHQRDALRLIVRHPWSMICLPLAAHPLLGWIDQQVFQTGDVLDVLDRFGSTYFDVFLADFSSKLAIILIAPVLVAFQISIVVPRCADGWRTNVFRYMGRFAGIVVWNFGLTIARPITGVLAMITTPISCAAVFTRAMSRKSAIEWTEDRSHGLETALVFRLVTMATMSLGVSLMIVSFFEMDDRVIEAVAFGTMLSTWTASGVIAFEDMVDSATSSTSEIGERSIKR